MPVILVSKVVDPKKNNWKKWRAKEEERHKRLLTPKNIRTFQNNKHVFLKSTGHGNRDYIQSYGRNLAQ
jgi:hypothetical protein